jgi:Xaa-Pro aminopeptidase
MALSVLIVDDHAGFRSFARALLESHRFRVVGEASDARSALDAAARLHPDVVLLDVQLPDGDGFAVAEWLREAGCTLVDFAVPREPSLDAIRRASRLCDVVQQAVKDYAEPGISEAGLAGLAAAAMFREAGRRVPAILTVSTGADGTETGGGVATARVVQAGDLVLTDTSPWIDGAWSDTANAVYIGTPDAGTRRRFDAVRRALHEGIELCRPGAVAKDVDRRVRAMLTEHGPTYPHHTGHAIGAAWSEEPRITPYEELRIEEGMVLALEPAIYLPGWGGIRLEHVFHVGAGGNEILTQFEHTL